VVVLNAGGSGFYRVRYEDDLFRSVSARLDELDALERCNLVADTWACVLAGLTPVADFLVLAGRTAEETDPTVWDLVLGALDLIDRVLPEPDKPALQTFVRALARPGLARLGWRPEPGEPERRGLLRATLLRALGTLGADEEVRARALELHRALSENPCAVDPQLLGAVVRVAAAAGGPDEYEAFLARWRSPANPQEELRYLYGLASFGDPSLMRRTLDLALTEVRSQNAPFLLLTALVNRARGPDAWEFVKARWDEIGARVPANTMRRMLEGVASLCTPELAAGAHAFLAAHPLPSGQRTVDQILERLDVHVAFAAREADHLGPLLLAGAQGR
jgi:aminopeptidase N